jgi:hypothetical protein
MALAIDDLSITPPGCRNKPRAEIPDQTVFDQQTTPLIAPAGGIDEPGIDENERLIGQWEAADALVGRAADFSTGAFLRTRAGFDSGAGALYPASRMEKAADGTRGAGQAR